MYKHYIVEVHIRQCKTPIQSIMSYLVYC